MLVAHKVSVLANGKKIVDEVDLEIRASDFITIVGPNGAGKTTLLKCLMGSRLPSSGFIQRTAGVRIGYVPQLVKVDPVLPLRVCDFLSLHRSGMSTDIDQVVELCGIADLLTQPLHHLSGGQWQRALLARAIVGFPQLLILDEPAQNLDIAGQLSFYRLLEKLHKEKNMSVLIVSHDLHFVLAYTKKVICMYHHICCRGEPRTIAQDPEFARMFGDDMAQVMAIYGHNHNHNHRSGH